MDENEITTVGSRTIIAQKEQEALDCANRTQSQELRSCEQVEAVRSLHEANLRAALSAGRESAFCLPAGMGISLAIMILTEIIIVLE
jgi:hypothetical protein